MTSYLRQKFGFNKHSLSSSSPDDHREKANYCSEAAIAIDDTETTNHYAAANGSDESYDDDVEERSKIKEIRALILSQHHSSSQDVDDLMIRRFLRARDHNIEKASHMLIKYLTWRKEFVPNGFISPLQVPNELAQNKVFLQGHDKLGRPIIVSFGRCHKQTTPEEFKRYVVFILDTICSRMPAGQEKCVIIADLKGWGYANSDVRGGITSLSILQSIYNIEYIPDSPVYTTTWMCERDYGWLQPSRFYAHVIVLTDYYPERLGKIFLVNVPSIFMTVWKMVYPVIDSKTKKKIIFVENKMLKSTLLNDIDESQLPETYGGKLPLVLIQDC